MPRETPDIRDWMRIRLVELGIKRTTLAIALGINPAGVTRLLAKMRVLQPQEYQTVDSLIGPIPSEYIPVERLSVAQSEIADNNDSRLVPVAGFVGAGSEAHFYSESQGPIGWEIAPDGSNEGTIAVEIRGDSLGLAFNNWLIFYNDRREPVTDDLIGRLCVVGLPDGRVLVKVLHRGPQRGAFNLSSYAGGDIITSPVVWAAKVEHLKQR